MVLIIYLTPNLPLFQVYFGSEQSIAAFWQRSAAPFKDSLYNLLPTEEWLAQVFFIQVTLGL